MKIQILGSSNLKKSWLEGVSLNSICLDIHTITIHSISIVMLQIIQIVGMQVDREVMSPSIIVGRAYVQACKRLITVICCSIKYCRSVSKDVRTMAPAKGLYVVCPCDNCF